MANYCNTCGKFIGDDMVYGAKHTDKAYCSESCARDADLQWEAEQLRLKRLDEEFPEAEKSLWNRSAFDVFQIVFSPSLCDKCTHCSDCRVSRIFLGRSICHCKYFHREEATE